MPQLCYQCLTETVLTVAEPHNSGLTDLPEQAWEPEAATSVSAQSSDSYLLREFDQMSICRGKTKEEKNCRVRQSKDQAMDPRILQVGKALRRALLRLTCSPYRLECKFQQPCISY